MTIVANPAPCTVCSTPPILPLQRGGKKCVAWICSVTLLALIVLVPSGPAQAADAERELSRLQAKSEDAMAQGDPQGAANSIGRAALLASQLDKQSDATQPPYRIMVDLFRAQEQVYRAIALFQQSGERTPASSGICSLLSQGRQHAFRALENHSATSPDHAVHDHLLQQTMEWQEIIQELQHDWDCRHDLFPSSVKGPGTQADVFRASK